MHRTNQFGIAHIVLIMLALMVSIIGFMGWRLMNKNSSAKQPAQASNQNKGEASSKEKKEVAIPADWQWFKSHDGTVKFAYPKIWGTLAETEKAFALGYYADTNNFMRPVTIVEKSKFLIQVPKSFYDTTWYSWDATSGSMVSAKDEKAPDVNDVHAIVVHDSPVALGATTRLEPYILSGTDKHPIFHVLGKGAMNCGNRNFFFDVNDRIVHISANLCERGGEGEPQAGQHYADTVETPLKELYNYIER